MTTVIAKKIADANHKTTLDLVTNLESIYGYSKSTYPIFHDFIRMSGRGWMLPKTHSFSKFIAFNQGQFQARCFEQADKLIDGYTGETWTISKNGIYCIDTTKKARFTVNSPNYTSEECNPLEAGLVVTLFALDKMMLHPNEALASAMIFYREYLITLIKDQAKLPNPLIDTTKVLDLID